MIEYIGRLDGQKVYSANRKDIFSGDWNCENIYILTDDGNKLFRNGKIIGEVDSNFTKVKEYGAYSYTYEKEKMSPKKKTEEALEKKGKTSSSEREEEKVSISEKETDVDKILEDSRKITVQDLVGDFNYDTY
jgi:hypothetical protein